MQMKCLNFKCFHSAFTIFLFTTFSSAAQPAGQMVLHHITEENGLSDNHIQCIYKDKNDFVWIGTLSGLNLLDGSAITVFKNDSGDSNSIGDNDILSLTGDKNGMLWVGTNTGLNSLNTFTKKFTRYHLPKNNLGEGDVINSLAFSTKGAVFIGTPRGLFCYENKKIISIVIPGNKNDLRKNNWVTSLTIDSKGVLWATTYNGLWSYNTLNHKITHEISDANDSNFVSLFTKVIEGHDGKIWVGTWDGGLKSYDPETKKILTYVGKEGPRNINTIAETKQPDGNYLLWVNGSLITFDQAQNKFIHQPLPSNTHSGLNITEMYKAADNWLWMGNDEGLYICNPKKTLFRQHMFTTPITKQGVAMLEWKNKLLVSGAGENFLKAYDDQLSFIDSYSGKISNQSICLSLKQSGTETIKAGTNEGMADINLRTHSIKTHPLQFLAKDFEAGNFITNIYEDSRKNWWVFPWRNGIWITDSSYNNFHLVLANFLSENGKPKHLVVGDAAEDKNNNLWFADYDEGIIFYQRSANKFSKPFIRQLGDRYSTYQILYRHNYCYAFSNAEIYMWNCDSILLHKIALPTQMDKPITSMALDSSGNIWLATRKGLIVYNKTSGNFDHFTTSDGLIKNDMDGTLFCRSNGTMVFGCPDYLTAFDPRKVLQSIGVIPSIQLTTVIAGGKIIAFNPAAKMIFNHSTNNFIFTWTVTDYNDPLYNNFYYKLAGIDTNWRYVGNQGKVEFANLSPGNYSLLLRAANANRVYANKILDLRFEIKPPFWRTWWFALLCLFAIVSIFYSLYRYRVSQVLKMERLRNKISLDLHDDIGSTLSSISILSEMALRQKKEEKEVETLQEIKQNSISLMDRMDDIVWSINPKNDSLENLLIRVKNFASQLFEAKEINYKIEIEEHAKQLHLSMEYRQHIYLIMKEAINNLVKYSNCSEAEIIVNSYHSILRIIIKDNGRGFNSEIQSKGNGLLNMRKRAVEMKATLDIISSTAKGTTISLAVKIK